jgi:hypothetical protein
LGGASQQLLLQKISAEISRACCAVSVVFWHIQSEPSTTLTDGVLLLLLLMTSSCRSGTFPTSGRRLRSLKDNVNAVPILRKSQLAQDALSQQRLLLAQAPTDVTPVGLHVGSLCSSINPALWALLEDPSYGELVADNAVCLNHPTALVRRHSNL